MALPALKLKDVRSCNASFVENRTIVAVFTGGTSGIGEYTIHALADQCEKSATGARIYIVGRNQDAAKTTSDRYKSAPNITFHFVKATDLSLLQDVDRCCDEIKQLETQSIDLLVMTHADLWFGGRRSTIEGLEKSMSLFFYSRIRFVQQLMPLLERSAMPNAARVVSVYAAGLEDPSKRFFEDDINLSEAHHYSYATMRNHATILKTLIFEQLADQHPNVSFTHVFPSLVLTDGYKTNLSPSWLRMVWFAVKPLMKAFFAVSSEESGQRTLALASHDRFGRREGKDVASSTNGRSAGGAYSCKYDGQINQLDGYQGLHSSGFARVAWQHTMDVFKSVKDNGVYEE